jgi:hypothetical protein
MSPNQSLVANGLNRTDFYGGRDRARNHKPGRFETAEPNTGIAWTSYRVAGPGDASGHNNVAARSVATYFITVIVVWDLRSDASPEPWFGEFQPT